MEKVYIIATVNNDGLIGCVDSVYEDFEQAKEEAEVLLTELEDDVDNEDGIEVYIMEYPVFGKEA